MNPAEFANIAAAESSHWWYRGMGEILLQELDRQTAGHPIARVLDAGCGTGATAQTLTQRYGWQVIALDASPVAIQWLKSRPLPALQASATSIPLADASCDAIVSLDLLVHLTPGDEAAALSEFARVLRPGGLLFLRAAAFPWLRSRHSHFIDERQRFTRPQLTSLTQAAGLQTLRCTYLNTLPLPLALLKFRLLEPLLRQKPATGLSPLPPWLDALLHHSLRQEARWLRTGRTLPLGQSLLLTAQRPRTPGP
jgi:SAM-dependent methyltransferase